MKKLEKYGENAMQIKSHWRLLIQEVLEIIYGLIEEKLCIMQESPTERPNLNRLA